MESGTLYVVATPLGNDGDLSPRAAAVLESADIILAEDTRRTGLLLKRLELERSGRLVSFHEHNEDRKKETVLDELEKGATVAMVSDAGTPLLSDPGYSLVRMCRERNIPVRPVPGPSAPVTVLSACGLPPLPYTFLGFPPRKHGQSVSFFAPHKYTGATLVLFERKSRVADTLSAAFEALGDREFCVAREATKVHEEFLYGRLGTPESYPAELLGEITIVIAPADKPVELSEDDVDAIIAEEQAVGGKPKEIARRVAARVPGWTAKAVYAKIFAS